MGLRRRQAKGWCYCNSVKRARPVSEVLVESSSLHCKVEHVKRRIYLRSIHGQDIPGQQLEGTCAIASRVHSRWNSIRYLYTRTCRMSGTDGCHR